MPPIPKINPCTQHTYNASSAGMKRRGEELTHSAKRIKCTTEEEKFTFDSLPSDILVAIIQQSNLVDLKGLLFTCKKFYSLVFTYIDKIHLTKEKELLNLNGMFKNIREKSYHNLKSLVTWVNPSISTDGSFSTKGAFNDQTLSSLIRFPYLTELSLGRNQVTNLSPESFKSFTALQKLEQFELDYCEVNSSELTPVLSTLSNLQVLRIRGIKMVQGDKLLSSIATTSLRRLALWSTKGMIPDSELAYLPRQTQLNELILATCTSEN